MSDLEKNKALSTKETTAAICLEVEEICARADRICDIVARSEGFWDGASKREIEELKRLLRRKSDSICAEA